MSARLLLCCCLLLVACAPPRHLVPREFEPVAYMVEDLAHGTDRNLDALIAERASLAQLAIANWLRTEVRNRQLTRYPKQIRDRRQRWPLLRSGLGRGLIHPHPSGRLQLRKDLDGDDRRLFSRPVREENRDRDRCDSILISLSELDPLSRRSAELLLTLRRIRHALDLKATRE